MPKMYLRQTRFSYSACGLFMRNKERVYTFKEIGVSRYIYVCSLVGWIVYLL